MNEKKRKPEREKRNKEKRMKERKKDVNQVSFIFHAESAISS